jgi:hypothetical protein
VVDGQKFLALLDKPHVHAAHKIKKPSPAICPFRSCRNQTYDIDHVLMLLYSRIYTVVYRGPFSISFKGTENAYLDPHMS